MTRIPYPTSEQLGRKCWNGANNAGKMCAHMPDDILAGWRSMVSAVLNNNTLDPMLREISIVRIGYLSGAQYEIHHHSIFARSIGVPDEKLDALLSEVVTSSAFTPREQAVVSFTDELVRNVRPSDRVMDQIQGHLSIPEIFTLIATIGAYMMVARVIEVTGIEIEPDAVFDPAAVLAK